MEGEVYIFCEGFSLLFCSWVSFPQQAFEEDVWVF
jgi:hypothetical protein